MISFPKSQRECTIKGITSNQVCMVYIGLYTHVCMHVHMYVCRYVWVCNTSHCFVHYQILLQRNNPILYPSAWQIKGIYCIATRNYVFIKNIAMVRCKFYAYVAKYSSLLICKTKMSLYLTLIWRCRLFAFDFSDSCKYMLLHSKEGFAWHICTMPMGVQHPRASA